MRKSDFNSDTGEFATSAFIPGPDDNYELSTFRTVEELLAQRKCKVIASLHTGRVLDLTTDTAGSGEIDPTDKLEVVKDEPPPGHILIRMKNEADRKRIEGYATGLVKQARPAK